MSEPKRKIHNGEYYVLITAAVFLRSVTYVITMHFESWLDVHEEFDFLFFTITDAASFVGSFTFIFYELGIADFLLFGLLLSLIVRIEFERGKRLFKILSVIGTALFAAVLTRLFMILLYHDYTLTFFSISEEDSIIRFFSIIRNLQPVIVYIIPISIMVFMILPGKFTRYIKHSLLKPSSIAFIFGCLALTVIYVYLSVTLNENLYTFDFDNREREEFFELLEFAEKLKAYGFIVDSLFATGVTLCFYRGAKLNIKEIVKET